MDARDYEAAHGKWYLGINEDRMKIQVEIFTSYLEDAVDESGSPILSEEELNSDEIVVDLPFKYVTCGLCDGKGKHVNPSIDYCGITQEDFDDDPGFKEDYFSGVYDVTCYRCHGKRVEPKLNIDEKSSAKLKAYAKAIDERASDDASYAAECAAERRMGA
jgi:hypothetical protein